MLSQLYQESVDTGIIPNLGKENTVIPMPKIPSSRELNHCRPVALISLPMKSLERLVLTKLSPHIQEKLDPMQFAYKRERSTDDTVATLIHNVTKHLEKAGNYIHILFIDFISAFNTMQRHKMIEQFLALQLPPPPTLLTGCITLPCEGWQQHLPQHHHKYRSAPRVCREFGYLLHVHQQLQERM